jgi:alanine dehydrogenase
MPRGERLGDTRALTGASAERSPESMRVGVPREIKADEARVALTPIGVSALRAHSHEIWIERGAGEGSRIGDSLYRAAGATIVEDAAAVWDGADLVLKVKEPIESELPRLREGLVLFTYLHLAANEGLTRRLLASGVRAVAYETLQLADGSLPLLAPMSEIAGRLAIQAGAWCLEARNGGRGVLLGGASGVRPAKVAVIGAGIAGVNACRVAVGMGAHTSVLDVNPTKLRYVHDVLGGRVTTLMSNRANLEEEVTSSDLVVGAVLIPGAKAPRLVSRALVRAMRDGSAIVDVSIDQGGCVETARPTSHREPTYVEEGVVHYGVTNMPGVVPHTSTYALTNSTLAYVLDIADHGLEAAMRGDPALRRALNVHDRRVIHPGVADAFGLEAVPAEEAIG